MCTTPSEPLEEMEDGTKRTLMVSMTTLYLVIFFAGTIGNSLVILVILKWVERWLIIEREQMFKCCFIEYIEKKLA